MTERAVYILVFQPRDDQATAQGLYYWIDLIHLVAPNAPVIVALSKQDEYEGYINDAGDLKTRHLNIVDFITVSCDQAHHASKNMQRLRQLVLDTVGRELGHVRYKLPASWMAVKNGLEQPGLDRLSYADYEKRCTEQGITDPEDQRLLARFLHDLGTMLNYADQMPLEQTHILNPVWVTDGVYAVVLSRQLASAEGVFDDQLLSVLLNDPRHKGRYLQPAQHFIREMMLTFKLCYEIAPLAGRRRYLVPNALPVDRPPDANLEDENPLRFEIRFPRILPTSIMSRFIVAMHSQRPEDRRWRLGLRSKIDGHDILVTAHPKERYIRISVGGCGPTRVRALEVIRHHFSVICAEKEGIGAKEFTFPPGQPEAEAMPFDELLEAERNDVQTIWRAGGVGYVSVRTWLDGVTDPISRNKLQKAIRNAKIIGEDSTTGINVTYIEHAEQVTGTDMSNDTKYTQNIRNSTFTNSPVGIQQMLQNSFNSIQNVPDGELKQALTELHGQVARLLESPEIKDPETVKENLETLVKEAAKPQPRRKWLELSSEGLIDAAKTIGEMAAPITATVKTILAMLAS